ncbi:methyltransferase domain-containing protein [Halopiger aswanensis]|uniref:Methyltransferase family protein n=1 Tax=Halopiger aswanensis TaxID=148449 RepID=A0A419W1G2_9EURY|nr:methyltransferase domain-containing protein [Halopiger aswanensis]RKD89298.1 methyltransferase family protein [Halopiger aswanensis]
MTTGTRTPAESIDEEKLDELVGTTVNDLGGAVQAALAEIGDRLGLYRAIADAGPLTSVELAERTDTAERYVREWLRAQAAGGYVTYDPETERYSLSPEQRAVLADEDSPAFMLGGFQGMNTVLADVQDDIEAAFRTGDGVGWHEHHPELFPATERFFKPGYAASLVSEWLPSLEGVDTKLKNGARVADVGCGYGATTILMAEGYPDSTFVGIDYHDHSIEMARERANEAGVGDRVDFEVATAEEYNGTKYDLVTIFDAFHDMGDPVSVAAHVRETLSDDGTLMLIEPYANDRVENNLNPVGRVFYGFSTMFCTPNSLDQGGNPALGAQAGEERLREVVTEGGFTRFRRAAETPFNLVLEVRP